MEQTVWHMATLQPELVELCDELAELATVDELPEELLDDELDAPELAPTCPEVEALEALDAPAPWPELLDACEEVLEAGAELEALEACAEVAAAPPWPELEPKSSDGAPQAPRSRRGTPHFIAFPFRRTRCTSCLTNAETCFAAWRDPQG